MKYKGQIIYEGYCVADAYVIKKKELLETRAFTSEDEELYRFYMAREEASKSFDASYENAIKTLGEEEATLFQTHKLMAEDGDLEDLVKSAINENNTAEKAIELAGNQLAEMFSSLDDDYMKERANDVREVCGVLISTLTGINDKIELTKPSVIICEELEASKLMTVDKSMLKGIVFTKCGANSHVAIFTRTLEIPSVCSLTTGSLESFTNGDKVALDACKGEVFTNPNNNEVNTILDLEKAYNEEKRALRVYIDKSSVSKNGKLFKIYANITSSNDAESAYRHNAEGIGLFRSEFLYLDSSDYPTEDEQFKEYKKVAEIFKEKEVIIRTFDIGADKKADYFNLPNEENPALGYRSVRICRDRPEMFKTQIRALLRASNYGNIAIMVPMIVSEEEVNFVHDIVNAAKEELASENIAFNKDIKIGIMIETPAAAVISDILAKKVDFFSIGTNDLSQYTLACDRLNSNLSKTFDSHHKAILRLINLVIQNGHRAGIHVGMCGELARDPKIVPYLMKMGLDEFSISSSYVLKTRKLMSEIDTSLVDLDKILN